MKPGLDRLDRRSENLQSVVTVIAPYPPAPMTGQVIVDLLLDADLPADAFEAMPP